MFISTAASLTNLKIVHISSCFINQSTNLSIPCSTPKRNGVLPNWFLLFTSAPVLDLEIHDSHTSGLAQNFFDYIVTHNCNVLYHRCSIHIYSKGDYDAVIECCSKRYRSFHTYDFLGMNYCVNYSHNYGLHCTKWF